MALILVVDDDQDVARLMATLLKQFGYETRAAHGGEEALVLLGERLPDLMIFDVMMPGMNGLELLDRVKANDRSKGVPVIMFSAANSDEYRHRAQAAGAVDYWVKASVGYDEMRNRLAKILPSAA